MHSFNLLIIASCFLFILFSLSSSSLYFREALRLSRANTSFLAFRCSQSTFIKENFFKKYIFQLVYITSFEDILIPVADILKKRTSYSATNKVISIEI